MIGYNKRTGATAFFESSDDIEPWVTLDKETLRMRGVMPWIDEPAEFNRAFVTPGEIQCVSCHQADPFITNAFIKAAKIPGTNETVVPILDDEAPYYVIGGENWDMRTIHIEGNACFGCHRVGMSTMTMFMENGWKPNEHMPPHDPGSLAEDLKELLEAWRRGPENVKNAEWIIPPARDSARRIVSKDYPYQAYFNRPSVAKSKSAKSTMSKEDWEAKDIKISKQQRVEIERLLKELPDPAIRRAFEEWIKKNGASEATMQKLRSMVDGDAKGREE
jgi:hypothetical protein